MIEYGKDISPEEYTETYCVFLRGINISGKNKIAMSDLKAQFESLGYQDVRTYLNSGNIVFSSDIQNLFEVRCSIEEMIRNSFGYDIPAYIISEKELQQILRHAPKWWGTEDKEKYDNLIFILSDESPQEISNMIGPVSEGLEQIEIYQNIIFWTFDRKSYQKCNWWKKTASSSIAEKLTIRTAGTIKKVCK